MDKNKSKTLNEFFELSNPNITTNLENLRWLWIDPSLLLYFEDRIKKIIWENPGSEDIVVRELEKTWISVENLFASYNREFRSILSNAANDSYINPDENLLLG